jgi:hypothetical protein
VTRRGLALTVVLCALALAACRADASIHVTITSSGAGMVAATLVLDRQAVAVVGDKVDLTDLRQQGWTVAGPAPAADGSESITVAHAFQGVDQGTALLARLGQPVHLTVTGTRGSLSSTVGIDGSVDLRGGVDALAGQVPGLPGGAAAALAAVAHAGGTVPAFSLRVIATLPGKPAAVVGGGTVEGTTVSWDAPLGAETLLGAKTTRTDTTARSWLIAAGSLAAVFVIAVAAESWLVARRRRA